MGKGTVNASVGKPEGRSMTYQPGLRTIVIGVGDYYVSRDKLDLLVTYALGSCVGVTAYDVKAGVGGILHFKLPHSDLNPDMAKANPALFGDTGLEAFLRHLFQLGATKPYLEIKLAGGAKSLGNAGAFFNIGERNLLIAQRFFWMNGLMVSRKEIGGSDYRTVKLEMETGRVTVKDPRETYEI